MKKCVGETAVVLTPSAQTLGLHPSLLLPFPSLPAFPLRRLTPRVFLSWGWDQPSHSRGGEEVWYRLAVPSVGEEFPDRELALPSPGSLPNHCPQDLRSGLPLGADLESVIPHLCPARAPPAPSSGLAVRPGRVQPGESVKPLGATRYHPAAAKSVGFSYYRNQRELTSASIHRCKQLQYWHSAACC